MFDLIIALPGGTIIVKGLSMFLIQNLGLSSVQLSYDTVRQQPYNVVEDFTLHEPS